MSRNKQQQHELINITQQTTNGNDSNKKNKTQSQIENGKIKKFDMLIRHIKPPIKSLKVNHVNESKSPFQNYSSIGNLLKNKKQTNQSQSKSNCNLENTSGNKNVKNILPNQSKNRKINNSIYNFKGMNCNSLYNINSLSNACLSKIHIVSNKNDTMTQDNMSRYKNKGQSHSQEKKEKHTKTNSIPIDISIVTKKASELKSHSKLKNKENESDLKKEIFTKINKIQTRYNKNILLKTEIEKYLNEVQSVLDSKIEYKTIENGIYFNTINDQMKIFKSYMKNSISNLNENLLKSELKQKEEVIQRLEYALNEYNYVISIKNKEIKKLKDEFIIKQKESQKGEEGVKHKNSIDNSINNQKDDKDNRIVIKNTQNDIFTLNTLNSVNSVESMMSIGSENCNSTGNLDILISGKKEFLKPINIPELLLDDVNVIYNGEYALNFNKNEKNKVNLNKTKTSQILKGKFSGKIFK